MLHAAFYAFVHQQNLYKSKEETKIGRDSQDCM